MSGTLHHCILVPQGEVRRRGSHFSLQEKLEAWLETCGLCGCEWGGCEWGGIHDMCESHNQLKIHYYALTSSHPHSHSHTHPSQPCIFRIQLHKLEGFSPLTAFCCALCQMASFLSSLTPAIMAASNRLCFSARWSCVREVKGGG